MVGILSFLQVNHSLDGRGNSARWYRLPSRIGPRFQLMGRRLSPDARGESSSLTPAGTAGIVRRGAARLLVRG